jgi:trimeric autotransporter adhesin
MKPQNMILIPILTISLGLLPQMQAVVPPPDGGYPNFNTAEGQNALFSLTTGAANTAIGWFSLQSNTDGAFNTGVGAGTLLFNVGDQSTFEGAANTAIGAAALLFNTDGDSNTAVGTVALLNNTEGFHNSAVGVFALGNNTTGNSNTANGRSALATNTMGENNTALGAFAGFAQTTGSNNVYIGANMLGAAGESNACYIASIFGQTAAGGSAVFIDTNNKLGTLTSSKRFKEDIKPMDKASEALFSLKPVRFRYKQEIDPPGTSQFGLVAEDVENVNPDLVVRDKDGKPYSVRYDQVNTMLLNEFLKQYRKVEEQSRKLREQETTIAQLKKEMEIVVARIKDQDAKIQKVSDQVEMDKSAPRVVAYEP